MKKLLVAVFSLTTFLILSCSKSDPGPDNNTAAKSIRYEFTADVAAAYGLHMTAGTAAYDTVINSNMWTKTMTGVRGTTGHDTASLIVRAPADWANTTNQANVTLKIFIDNVEKGSKSLLLVWLDRPSGNEVKVAF